MSLIALVSNGVTYSSLKSNHQHFYIILTVDLRILERALARLLVLVGLKFNKSNEREIQRFYLDLNSTISSFLLVVLM